MRMLGNGGPEYCKWYCCASHDISRSAFKRRAKRREKRQWKKEFLMK